MKVNLPSTDPTSAVRLTLIAAVSDDGYISRHRGVPWHLPRDKAHFRAATQGHWLLLGRTTYDEMHGWFRPGQTPLILSRNKNFTPAEGHAVSTVEEALQKAQNAQVSEILVLGGGQIYAAAFPYANRLILTHVHSRLGSGISFPALDPTHWKQTACSPHPADSENEFALTFATYERRP